MSSETEFNLAGLIPKRWVGRYVSFYYQDDYPYSERRGIVTDVSTEVITLLENRLSMNPSIAEYNYQLRSIREIDTFSKNPNPWGRMLRYIHRNGGGMLMTATRGLNRTAGSDIRFDRKLLEKSYTTLAR